MSSGRILVVDDSPSMRGIITRMLKLAGHEVMEVATGEECLQLAKKERPDLILLDIVLPGMDGVEVCRRIKGISATRLVPVVMITSLDQTNDRVRALDAGADDYMTKPFGSPELLARIRAALRRLPQVASGLQTVRVDDMEINFAARRVTVGSKEIRLTPKEFDLLQYMVSHPNMAIPHTRLLQSVWGPDYGDEVEYLRVFMNQLRKKIEKNPSTPKYLITEPWIGYRFELRQDAN